MATPILSNVFTAKYPGTCRYCKKGIQLGQQIRKVDLPGLKYGHVQCQSVDDDRAMVQMEMVADRVGTMLDELACADADLARELDAPVGREAEKSVDGPACRECGRMWARMGEAIACCAEVKAAAKARMDVKVPDGTYTVVDGSVRRTLRLRTRKDGGQVASFLSGSNNDTQYTRFAYVRGDRMFVWKEFKGDSIISRMLNILLRSDDHLQFGEAYALESSRCFRCNHTLTVPVSIYRGLGPECAAKMGV